MGQTTAFVQRNILSDPVWPVKRIWYRDPTAGDCRSCLRTRGSAASLCCPMSAAHASTARSKPDAGGAAARKDADRGGATWSISDLAQEFALTTRAIRFYEDEGLLAPVRRGQTRVYGERERTRIKLILRGKRLGLALSEIRELFDIYATTGNERPQLAKFLQMLADRRAMLLQQREDIDAVLVEMSALERDCRRRLRPARAGR
jgi:DNA-binding transcriptional MerR regulator